MEKVLFKYIDDPEQYRIDNYIKNGGYQALPKALKEFKPDEVIEEVKKSGLRGRGGAGFPAGLKWSFVPKNTPKPKYLCCNADESEPGTCKDRVLMERDPHMVVEGIIIASYAIQAHHAFVYVRGEFAYPAMRMEEAVNEAYEKGFLGKNILGSGYDLDVIVHTGGGAYIGGSVNTGGGDFVGRDKIIKADRGGVAIGGNVTNSNIVTGDKNVVGSTVNLQEQYIQQIYEAIEAHPDTTPLDKEDMKAAVEEIQQEGQKDSEADETFIARRLRNIQRMAPDILDVVLTTIANPLAGFGMVARKVAEKMQAEAN